MTDEPAADLNAGAQSAAHNATCRQPAGGVSADITFFRLTACDASAGAVDLDADADWQDLCYAIVAVALDLVWGYAGMLSLGHGIFFAWAATRWACT